MGGSIFSTGFSCYTFAFPTHPQKPSLPPSTIRRRIFSIFKFNQRKKTNYSSLGGFIKPLQTTLNGSIILSLYHNKRKTKNICLSLTRRDLFFFLCLRLPPPFLIEPDAVLTTTTKQNNNNS